MPKFLAWLIFTGIQKSILLVLLWEISGKSGLKNKKIVVAMGRMKV
ncbi:hypothetical protein [Desulfomarina profundi]|nr:hypothetical protein [Desulfomarina profundi]